MQNFTEEIKNEIAKRKLDSHCCKVALISAFLCTGGTVLFENKTCGFKFTTENETTAEFILDILENEFNLHIVVASAKFDLLSSRDKLTFECISSEAKSLLVECGIISINGEDIMLNYAVDDRIVENPCCKAAYIMGAFLGGGSCTLPAEGNDAHTGYHFEIVFLNRVTANDFSALLCDFELFARLVTRKESTVVYVKSQDNISSLLDIMAVNSCLEKLNKLVESKHKSNKENRVNNCSVSNIDKTVTASVNQVRAIEIIAETIGLQSLDKLLFEVATARLADKNASMQELATRLDISKSCINHRMRRILELARSLGGD